MSVNPRTIWFSMASALLIALSLAVVVGAIAGSLSGLFLLLFLLLVGMFLHTRHMARLVHWAQQAPGTPLPTAIGAWAVVYAELAQKARHGLFQRERLTAALARFREASNAMPDGVVFLSRGNVLEWVNQRAERHFGLDSRHDLGAPMVNLVRQPDFVRYLDAADFSEPLFMHSVRGENLALLVYVTLFGEGQKMVTSRDMTQIERLETMRRDFVANVSHELRTPLTVVSGFLETLSDGLEDLDEAEIRHYLSLAHSQSMRMQRLIEDLLTLSALETGAQRPHEELVDVAEMLDLVLRETQMLSAGRHQITLEVEGNPWMHGRAKELYSAFSNLAGNAVRYTPDGGQVALRWRADADGAEFRVTDSGIGIAEEHIPRLTERFYRVDRGRSRETGGTGLGLAIVKHILTQHQAVLEVKSALGEGSRFSACFPADRLVQPQELASHGISPSVNP